MDAAARRELAGEMERQALACEDFAGTGAATAPERAEALTLAAVLRTARRAVHGAPARAAHVSRVAARWLNDEGMHLAHELEPPPARVTLATTRPQAASEAGALAARDAADLALVRAAAAELGHDLSGAEARELLTRARARRDRERAA